MLGALGTQAQTVVESTKWTDNWSVGVNAGAATPLGHSAFFKGMRPAVGFNVGKQFTPVFGMGLLGTGYINNSPSKTVFDASDVNLYGTLNLMNLFGGYDGLPRSFEIETVTGLGWLHGYMNGSGDSNDLSTRLGLNFNFNLGASKAWTIGIKPALVYNMTADSPASKFRFNANNASFELTAGLTYHLKNADDSRHFRLVRVYDQMEVDDLNAYINDLRMQVDEQNDMLSDATQRISALQADVNKCRDRAATVVTVVENNRVPESVVTFRQGKSVVDASQLPNVERVASYLNKHAGSTVLIKGYASPEGSKEVNERLAAARAEAVKNILVKRYKIDVTRIKTEGLGVGDMFSEPDWNRISICTIKEAK